MENLFKNYIFAVGAFILLVILVSGRSLADTEMLFCCLPCFLSLL